MDNRDDLELDGRRLRIREERRERSERLIGVRFLQKNDFVEKTNERSKRKPQTEGREEKTPLLGTSIL